MPLQGKVLDLLDNIMKSLVDETKMENVPQEEIEKAMANVLAAVAGVTAASDIMGNYPSLDDLDHAQNDPQWKEFDASPTADNTEPDVTNAGSYEEAMALHSAHVHKKLVETYALEIAQRCLDLNKNVTKAFSSFAIPGQSLDTASYRGRGTITKDYVGTFAGQTLHVPSSAAAVDIPSDVSGLFMDLLDSDDIIIIKVKGLE
ncbi:hypothetical protein PoB_001554400 [Plakobranchus ocellatus]|uniref:Uncharacterized protein n=1 Tax=Plakobranchus ocellatus TaxID=259542 RepID=A0AAV3Z154_9GAST|nr:hypothetical protein PoB_001554400 [Plakobranchus ocellatus]